MWNVLFGNFTIYILFIYTGYSYNSLIHIAVDLPYLEILRNEKEIQIKEIYNVAPSFDYSTAYTVK